MGEDQLIPAGEGMELVGGGDKGLSGEGCHLACHGGVEALGGVEAGAHSGAAQGQLAEGGQGGTDEPGVPLQGGAPAADLLTQGDGHRVLEVGAARLDHIGVLPLQPLQGAGQPPQGGEESVLQGQYPGDVHGGGEGVVGGLG